MELFSAADLASSFAPLVLVPVEEVLDLLDADDVHLGVRQALMEEVLDPLVGLCASWNVHQAVVLL